MAALTRLDDRTLKALKPADKPYNRHLGGGLYAYVYPNGRVVCRYQYQVDGKRRKLSLGEYVSGKGRAADLFKRYQEAHTARIVKGVDPVAEQKRVRAEAERERYEAETALAEKQSRATVAGLAADFLQNYTGSSPEKRIADSTRRAYRGIIGKYLLPSFGHFALDELPEDELLDFIEGLAKTRPTGANQVHACFSAVFRWATEQRRYNNPRTGGRRFRRNPLAGVRRPAPKVKKNRVLDFSVKHGRFQEKGEIKAFWEWLDTLKNQNHADALRLILMIGVRPSEILSLQWEDVFDDEIVVPAHKMKSQHNRHTVPLTPQLRALVDDVRAKATKIKPSDYLFPKRPRSLGGKNEGERSYPHVGHATLSDHVRNALRSGDLDMPKFTPHDLRRSVATHVSSLGFSSSDVNVLLHHKEGGVIEHYDYADPVERKLAMLATWHNRLDELIHGERVDNVIGIRGSNT